MTSGIAEQLDSEESMAHVKDRKGNSPENIKANEDEFIKTKEINEKKKMMESTLQTRRISDWKIL